MGSALSTLWGALGDVKRSFASAWRRDSRDYQGRKEGVASSGVQLGRKVLLQESDTVEVRVRRKRQVRGNRVAPFVSG